MPAGASIRDVRIFLRSGAAAAIVVLAISGCTVTNVVEEPDPAAIPSGEPAAQGAEATGPLTVVGSGRAVGLNLGWRYAVYESADGLCTQLEMAQTTSAACGSPLPAEGEHIGGVSVGGVGDDGITVVDGIVSDEVVTVWIVDEQQGRVPATIMPLEEAGLEGQAFVGFMPSDGTATHIQAVAVSGEILQTYELP
jgi:hypothetical protein